MTEKYDSSAVLSFTGKLGNYRIIDTDDGSKSLWSEAFDENCHSLSGAVLETVHNYIEGCQIRDKHATGPLTILEIGFGTGLGAALTFNHCQELQQLPVHFISLELDLTLVEWAKGQPQSPEIIRQLQAIQSGPLTYFQATVCHFTLTVVIGDARKTIHQLPTFLSATKINAVYQDAFSPKKNPTLWTVEWFKDLKQHCATDVILSTYSSSSRIRKSLLAAEWIPEILPGFQGKKEGTLARITGEISATMAEHLMRSPVSALTDKELLDKSS